MNASRSADTLSPKHSPADTALEDQCDRPLRRARRANCVCGSAIEKLRARRSQVSCSVQPSAFWRHSAGSRSVEPVGAAPGRAPPS